MEGMDELLTRDYGQQAEQDKQVREDLLLEVGTYRTLPALTMNKQESDRINVTDPVTRTERPRFSFRYFAQVQEETSGKKGGIGFSISPDRVITERGPDTESRRWVQAVTTFKLGTGREPQNIQEVGEFIRDYPVRLKITRLKGKPGTRFEDPSNFIQSLSPIGD